MSLEFIETKQIICDYIRNNYKIIIIIIIFYLFLCVDINRGFGCANHFIFIRIIETTCMKPLDTPLSPSNQKIM